MIVPKSTVVNKNLQLYPSIIMISALPQAGGWNVLVKSIQKIVRQTAILISSGVDPNKFCVLIPIKEAIRVTSYNISRLSQQVHSMQ